MAAILASRRAPTSRNHHYPKITDLAATKIRNYSRIRI